MNNLLVLYWSLIAERVLLALADVTVKSVLVFLAAGALALALRRSSAAYRHLVWRLALASLVVLPILSAVVPSREVTAVSHTVQITPAPALPVPEQAAPPVVTDAQVNGKLAAAVVRPVSAAPASPGLSPDEQGQFRFFLVGAISLILIALWLAGVAACALPTLFALLKLPRLARPLLPLTPAQAALAEAAALAAVPNRGVRVRIASASSAVRVPMTWGVWHPIIALPAEAAGWTEERLRAALLHEMAHVRRGDWLTQVLVSFLCSLYWFNPLVWIAARLLRGECERAADDFAVTHGLDAPAYAGHLLEIALALRNRRLPRLTVPMMRQSRLEARLRAVLAAHPRQELTARGRAVALAAAAGVLLAGSAFRFSSKAVGSFPATPATRDSSASARLAPSALSSVTLPNGAVVRLAGVVDTQAASPRAWAADGSALSTALPKNTLVFPHLPAGAEGRAFAFAVRYVPTNQPGLTWVKPPTLSYEYTPDTKQKSVFLKKPQSTWEVKPDNHLAELSRFQQQDSQQGASATMLTLWPQAFSSAHPTCTAKVGVAAGPWTQTVQCPKTPGKTHISTATGEVIFTLIPNPHHLRDPQAIRRGNAVFMVTDHFDTSRDPSGAAIMYERSVLALDRSGRVVCDLAGTLMPGADGKYEQQSDLPNAVLAQVASFRLLARPYQWAEFRDVQLQPNAHITALRRTVKSNPNDAEAQYQLAQALYSINDKHFSIPRQDIIVSASAPPAVLAEAIQHLRKAVALQPGNAGWQSTLGTYLQNQGHDAEAVLFYKQALHLLGMVPVVDLSRSSPFLTGRAKAQQVFDNQWLLGDSLLRIHRYQEAAAYYQKALRFNSTADWVLLSYGDALAGEGKQAEARVAWKNVLAVTTANDYYGRQARARLAGKK